MRVEVLKLEGREGVGCFVQHLEGRPILGRLPRPDYGWSRASSKSRCCDRGHEYGKASSDGSGRLLMLDARLTKCWC